MLAGFEYKWWIRLQDVLLQYNLWNILNDLTSM